MFRKKFTVICAAAAAMLGASAVSHAATYTVTSLDGSQPGFTYDTDKPAPQVTSEGFHAQGSRATTVRS